MLIPQWTSAKSIEQSATRRIDARGVRGRAASHASARRAGGDTATMLPVNMTRHICIEKGRSSQKPSPHAATHVRNEARPTVTPRARTIRVRSQAIVKVPGTTYRVQSVSRVAARENAAWVGMAAGRYQMGSMIAPRRGRGGFEDGIAPARGVECAPMNAEVAAIGPSRAALPGIADYLRAIWDLGRRSLKPALPALAFLYFYRLGMGAYIAMSDYGYPHGADAIGAIVPQIVVIASFVPLLLLVYTPVLPLQDALLRGREMSFLAAIRRVLETAWNFMLSGIAQMLVFFVPVAVILVLAGIMIPSTGGEAASARLLAMSVAFLGGFTWCLVAGILMIFATPAVVLDGEGPVQSIRTSFRLVTRNLGGVLGRLIAFAFLSFV